MRTEPEHVHGGFVYHISTEQAQRADRLTEGEGGKVLCSTCYGLLQRGRG